MSSGGGTRGYTNRVELWLGITLVAAFLQNARSLLQKRLTGALSVNGAAYVRFSYALPFAWLYAGLLWGGQFSGFTVEFALPLCLAGIWEQSKAQRVINLKEWRWYWCEWSICGLLILTLIVVSSDEHCVFSVRCWSVVFVAMAMKAQLLARVALSSAKRFARERCRPKGNS